MHRFYGFDFPFIAKENAKDDLFIPAGFDSLNLMFIKLKEGEKDLRYENEVKDEEVRNEITREQK